MSQEWENLGNALEEFGQSYGGDSLAYDDGVVDSVVYDENW